MEEKSIDKKSKYSKKNEFTTELLELYFKNNHELQNSCTAWLHDMIKNHAMNHDSLMKLYLAIRNQKSDSPIIFYKLTYEKEICTITYKEKQRSYKRADLLRTLGNLADLTEDVLPLGSLVRLKKEYFQDNLDTSKIGDLRIVITHRFIKQKDKSYYTYGGVVYPAANFNSGEILKFTPSLIDQAIHKGFQDEQDDSYVYLMKKEFILEKGMHLVGFLSEEDENEH